jgi:hypothetical protein
MPKEGAMTQLSRPYQIALVAMGLLVAVWFVALRGHSSGGGGSSRSTPAGAAAPKPAAPSSSYPSAPGVAGLTRAIQKAHGAVSESERNAKQLQEKAAQASSASPAAGAGASAPSSGAGALTHAASPSSRGTSAAHSNAHPATAPRGSSHPTGAPRAKAGAALAMQHTVEAELKQGKLVVILFWNPSSTVDATVQRELLAVQRSLGGSVAVHVARAGQVGSFGVFTRTIQVLQTPTMLVVNKHGQTTTLVGLTDAFTLRQAVAEAKR